MAIVKRTLTLKNPMPIRKTAAAVSTSKMKEPTTYQIPTEPTEPTSNLNDYSWMFYGAKKIGKTTLSSTFPDAIFFMFEPGAKALRLLRVNCNTWEDALGYLKSLEDAHAAGTLKIKTVVIDTGFEAYEKCSDYICAQEKIEYPREDNFGKDWKKIKNEFRAFHNRIAAMGLGMIILCHETAKEQQDFNGNKYDQMQPALSKGAFEYYKAVIDNVCWYHYRGNERFLLIKGNDHAMAGVGPQIDSFFKTTTGEPVYAIPLTQDPRKGMQAIKDAFTNKQIHSYKEEVEKEAKAAVRESINAKLRKRKA